ncbi:hypothetical protein FGADI_6487 [Fusarium gaditjirri]|uniref:Ricin B lectin domain-containing protein n=1 Tax=Fusarium gaditjirri TaxID=282569 RepID=A0A8H4T7G8_9HYPO|nr:hypothetical protein FGADI_6487 [Fusarium gaditjirri]
MPQAGRIYIIRNDNTGTVLDENQYNNWVRAWGHRGCDNQKWELNRDGPSRKWWLRNLATGRFLTPEDVGIGSALRTEDEPFRWHISSAGNGFRLASLQPDSDIDLYVEVKDAAPDDDSIIMLWERKGNNQVWYLEEV